MFGRGFVLTLCEEIAYSSNGFFIKFDKVEQREFCDDYNIREDKFNAMFNMLLDLNFFDKAMYEEYHILTNEKIQEAFLEIATKKQLQKIEYVEYILPCFASKIHKLTLNLGGNVDTSNEKLEEGTQTKQNKTIVDKSVNNIKNDIYNATDEQVLKLTTVYTLTDVDNVIKTMSETDKSRLDQLVNKFDDGETFSFDFVTGDYKVSAYQVLFALIDLLNAPKESYTIKIGGNAQRIDKKLLIQMIYELTTLEFVHIVETVANRKDIRILPFFILGMIVRIDNRKEEEKKKMLHNTEMSDYYNKAEQIGLQTYNKHREANYG